MSGRALLSAIRLVARYDIQAINPAAIVKIIGNTIEATTVAAYELSPVADAGPAGVSGF